MAACSAHVDNAVSTTTEARATTKRICQLPVDIGRCRAAKPRYYFNALKKRCDRFFWGGCGGNDNRFMSEDECSDACQRTDDVAENEERLEAALAADRIIELVLPELRPATPVPQCSLGEAKFNLGDSVRFSRNSCKTCECSTPPLLTCQTRVCTWEHEDAPNLDCRLEYDDGNCCPIGWKCPNDA